MIDAAKKRSQNFQSKKIYENNLIFLFAFKIECRVETTSQTLPRN